MVHIFFFCSYVVCSRFKAEQFFQNKFVIDFMNILFQCYYLIITSFQ